MPGNPVNIAGVNKNGQRVAQVIRLRKELTEEELLEQENNKTQILIINF
jgi:hypothetical protein